MRGVRAEAPLVVNSTCSLPCTEKGGTVAAYHQHLLLLHPAYLRFFWHRRQDEVARHNVLGLVLNSHVLRVRLDVGHAFDPLELLLAYPEVEQRQI